MVRTVTPMLQVQCHNVFNREGGQILVVRAVTLMFHTSVYQQYNVFYQESVPINRDNGPVLFVTYNVTSHWKETISHFCDTLEM